MLKLSLEQRGEFEILEVNVASQARRAARLFKPDLILMDVMMPEMDGGTLASQLQEDPELKSVPIIFLTAAVKKGELLARNGIVGGLPFLAKPIESRELKDCLRKHLN